MRSIPFLDRVTRTQHRSGTATVEATIVLFICMFILFSMLEMSIVLVRYTIMSEAARRIARAAVVHGGSDHNQLTAWGPAPLNTDAASSSAVALAVRDILMTLNPKDVSLSLVWPDGDNLPDQRVQVTVRYTHHPIVSMPGLYSQLELQGASTMRIAH